MTFISHTIELCRRRLAAITLLAGLCAPAPLFAHTHLVKSIPAAGGRVVGSPKLLRLWFSKAPELKPTRVTLVTETGDTIPLRPVVHDQAGSKVVAALIPKTLRPGTYRVLWRTAAADGHAVHGQFSFMVVGAGAGGR